MKSEKPLMVLGFVVISLIWGSTWLAIKLGLESIPPFYGIAFRFSLAVLILYVMMKLRSEVFPLDTAALKLYAVLGLCSFSIPFGFVYWGQQYISSGLASILFGVYPFVVAIFSHITLQNEKINIYKFSGIMLGFVGVAIIFWEDIHIGEVATTGMFAILAATVLQGFSLVVIKKHGKQISSFALNLGGMLVGVPVMYLMALLAEDFSAVRFDAIGIGTIVYLGTLGTVVTFVVYFWLLKRVEAVYMSLVSFVTPIIAVILGALLLDEKFSPRVFAGAAFVLLGILMANGKDIIETVRNQAKRCVISQEDIMTK